MTVNVESRAFRLFWGGAFSLDPNTDLVLALGAGVEIKTADAASMLAEVRPTSAFTMLDPLIRPAVGIERRLGQWLIGTTIGVDVDLLGTRYSIEGALGRTPIWSGFRLRRTACLQAGLVL